MTTVEVLFRYGMPPGEKEMSALGLVSDVYGIRRVQFNEPGAARSASSTTRHD